MNAYNCTNKAILSARLLALIGKLINVTFFFRIKTQRETIKFNVHWYEMIQNDTNIHVEVLFFDWRRCTMSIINWNPSSRSFNDRIMLLYQWVGRTESLDMVWEEEEVQTTWQEVSTFYRYGLKSVTCSQYDFAERGPICHTWIERKNEEPPPGLDFFPIVFQSLFYVQTTKGSNVLDILLNR